MLPAEEPGTVKDVSEEAVVLVPGRGEPTSRTVAFEAWGGTGRLILPAGMLMRGSEENLQPRMGALHAAVLALAQQRRAPFAMEPSILFNA